MLINMHMSMITLSTEYEYYYVAQKKMAGKPVFLWKKANIAQTV